MTTNNNNNTTSSSQTTTTTTSSTNGNNNNKNLQQQRHKEVSSTDVTRRMICGGVAGMIAKTATNPLERMKMLSQTGEHHHSTTKPHTKLSMVQLYRTILQREGVFGLWAGNGANLLRVFPAKAVVFSSNDYYRSFLSSLVGQDNDNNKPLPSALSFLAGGMSGMTATAVTYPLDLARGRISGTLARTDGSGRPKAYRGILQTLVRTVREEGVRALYKGMTPTVMGAMPYEGIKFGTVGLLETLFPSTKNSQTTDLLLLSTPTRNMIYGGLGGISAGLITYPNDTVRRLLQLQGSRGTTATYTGYWDCVRQTYRAHGITRFYHGLTINLIRMAPNTALQFYFYALFKTWTQEWV